MKKKFPGCYTLLTTEQWLVFEKMATGARNIAQLIASVRELPKGAGAFPACCVDLLRLEGAIAKARAADVDFPTQIDLVMLTPNFEMLAVSWLGLPNLVRGEKVVCRPVEDCYLLIWQQADSDEVFIKQASAADILALKVVVNDEDPLQVAKNANVPVGRVDSAIEAAIVQGILLKPESNIQRQGSHFIDKKLPGKFLKAEVFTLQWHLTQACDLHCKHCYDRSSGVDMPLSQALNVLDDFRQFCLDRFVDGQVSFTGGNPFLYPHFMALYQAAVDRNLGVAILGNPVPTVEIDALLAVQKPSFYQVSLEGLEEHNDWIRGEGHFQRILKFLALLKSRKIYAMVMLTLTQENQDQVLGLAEILRDRADLFTFNRLSMVGEGANLQGADVAGYQSFLTSYLQAAKGNSVMALKDNMINIIKDSQGEPPFGGCAGFGCGAAFNFVAILPDGEVHACRKYPSPIGNIFSDGLAAVYDSQIAQRYRHGSVACEKCEIRPVCGGCPAVVYGLGMDTFNDLDPYCFIIPVQG